MVSAAAIGWAEHRPEAIGWYWASADASHRDALLTVVERFAPFDSVLDLGCHCGPLRRRLRERFGSAFRYVGVDVNASALEAGRRFAADDPNAFFFRLDITTEWPELACVPDILKTFDVVLSSGCLTCVEPSALDDTLETMQRIAKRACIVQEPYAAGPESTWVDGTGWAHPYPSWVVKV